MNFVYVVAPVVGFLVAGGLKFTLNCLREKRMVFDLIGLGGMPSTHTTIISTVAALIAAREGFDSPALSVACALVIIVVIDAMDLRQKIGRHAAILKRLDPNSSESLKLRTQIGHKPIEVLAGVMLGIGGGVYLGLFW